MQSVAEWKSNPIMSSTPSGLQPVSDWAKNLPPPKPSFISKVGGVLKDYAQNVFNSFKQVGPSIISDVQEGAKTINKGGYVNQGLGEIKSGFRVAGDFANALFSPISAAIGTALQVTGGQKLVDKAGQVIADKSGITDLPAFQNYAISHPQAGEDFNRLLMLALAVKEGKTKATPEVEKQINTLGKDVVTKLASDTVAPKGVQSVAEWKNTTPTAEVTPQIAPTETTGMRTSGLATTLETQAIAKGIETDFGDLPTYSTRNMAESASKALDFVKQSPDEAKAVAEGSKPPPFGLLVGDVYSALKVKAFNEGDAQTLLDLSKSKANDIATAFGQNVKAFDAGLSNDPVQAIREINKSRDIIKPSVKSSELRSVKSSLEKVRPKKQDWVSFIKELQC